jgi:hypothetical protein
MLIIRLSLAFISVAALMLRPRGVSSAIVVAAAATIDIALGAGGAVAVTVVGPLR